MIDKNPGAESKNIPTGLSESSLNAEAVSKLTHLGVSRETAIKLADLREQMNDSHTKELKQEFAELSQDERTTRINQINNILAEHRDQILKVSDFERSILRQSLNSQNEDSGDNRGPITSTVQLGKTIGKLGIDTIFGFGQAVTHPITSAKYIFAKADEKLTDEELNYTITT